MRRYHFTPTPVALFRNLDDLPAAEACYAMMKDQRRMRRVGLAVKLLILGGLLYGYVFLTLPENAETKEALIVSAQGKFEEFLFPIVESTVTRMTEKIQADMLKDAKIPAGNGAANPQTLKSLSPEAVRAICESLPKK